MSAVTKNPYRTRPSWKFSLPGMMLALLAGLAAATAVGLAFYGISLVVSFSIPLLFPMIAGALAGATVQKLGATVGQCRNPAAAIAVAFLAGSMAWGTGHIVDYIRFRAASADIIREEVPDATAQEIDYVIDAWLEEETGVEGFRGFMRLKASESTVEITFFHSGIPFPFAMSGAGLMIFWFFEYLVAVGAAVVINKDYAGEPYCEKCKTWRKFRTPIVGTIADPKKSIACLEQRDFQPVITEMKQDAEGRLARLQVEYCPTCYDSKGARMIVIEDIDSRSWREITVWSAIPEPHQVRQIVEAEK